MTIQEMVIEAHSTAKEKGWWDETRNRAAIHMLCVTELAEATEAARIGDDGAELVELADCVIRIADYCGAMGWDLEGTVKAKMTMNKLREHRHGGKLF